MAISVGLELGASVVRAVSLERRGATTHLLASSQVPCAGSSTDELVEAIVQVRKALPITHPVVVGIPTGSAIVTTVQPLIVNRQRPSLGIQFELQQQLPYEVAQSVWHYHWLSPNGHSALSTARLPTTLSAVVAATKRTVLEEYLEVFRRAKLSVQTVGVTALAAANAWIQQLDPGSAPQGILLCLDGSTLEWIVMNASGLHIFPVLLPVASLAPVPNAGPADAGQGGSSRDVEEGHVLSAVKASLSELQEQLALNPSTTVWLVGAFSAAPQVVEALKRDLGCRVELLSPARTVKINPTRVQSPESFAVAVGLALQGVGLARLPVNLMVEASRRRRVGQMRLSARSASVVCAGLAIGFSAQGMLTTLKTRQAVLQHLLAQERTYQKLRPEVRTLLQHHAQLEARLQQLEGLVLDRGILIQAFQQVTEAMPDDVWFTTLELSKGAALEGVVEGYSRSFQGVTRLMDQLKSSVGWTSVKPLATTVTTDAATGKEQVAFTVQLQQPFPPPAPPTTPRSEASASRAPASHPAGKPRKGQR